MMSIANSLFKVNVKPCGAELCSIRGTSGFEYLWQADATLWGRHAPVLFPIVGKLCNGQYKLNGRTYEMPQHGFARDMDFNLIEQSQTSLCYQLLPTSETRSCYPFEFALNILYSLNSHGLNIEYAVRNTGCSVMPFSIGAHPGFTLPGPIEECFLEFEKVETLNTRRLTRRGLLSEETDPVLNHTSILPLTPTLFNRDALIFFDAQSDRVTLGAKNSPRRLTVEFPGFPQLGIWAKPNAPFVCIEPWYGYADPEEPYGDIWNKPGIIKLPPGKMFTCIYRITVE